MGREWLVAVAVLPSLVAACGSPAMCVGVSCSGHGTCEIAGSVAVCECDEGYHPVGLTCVESPCARMTCPPYSECVQSGGETFCQCDDGFLMDAERCVPDVNVTPGNCPAGGSSVVLDGDAGDTIHPGRETIAAGEWSVTTSPDGSVEPHTVDVRLRPSNPLQGDAWIFQFSSAALGEQLSPQVYEDAQRIGMEEEGHPGLLVGGNGLTCNTVRGRFQVTQISTVSSGLSTFVAVFEQRCGDLAATLRGCVRYEAE